MPLTRKQAIEKYRSQLTPESALVLERYEAAVAYAQHLGYRITHHAFWRQRWARAEKVYKNYCCPNAAVTLAAKTSPMTIHYSHQMANLLGTYPSLVSGVIYGVDNEHPAGVEPDAPPNAQYVQGWLIGRILVLEHHGRKANA